MVVDRGVFERVLGGVRFSGLVGGLETFLDRYGEFEMRIWWER